MPKAKFDFEFKTVDEIIDLLRADLVSDKVQRMSLLKVLDDLLVAGLRLQLSQLHLMMIQLASRGDQILQDYLNN